MTRALAIGLLAMLAGCERVSDQQRVQHCVSLELKPRSKDDVSRTFTAADRKTPSIELAVLESIYGISFPRGTWLSLNTVNAQIGYDEYLAVPISGFEAHCERSVFELPQTGKQR